MIDWQPQRRRSWLAKYWPVVAAMAVCLTVVLFLDHTDRVSAVEDRGPNYADSRP